MIYYRQQMGELKSRPVCYSSSEAHYKFAEIRCHRQRHCEDLFLSLLLFWIMFGQATPTFSVNITNIPADDGLVYYRERAA